MLGHGKVASHYTAARLVSSSKCNHFFRCLDTDGSMRDSAGGVVWKPSTATITYDSDLKALSTDMANDATPESVTGEFATWDAASACVVVIACRMTDGTAFRFALGDTNEPDGVGGIGVTASTLHFALGPKGNFARAYVSEPAEFIAGRYDMTSENDGNDVVITCVYEPGSNVTRLSIYDIDTYDWATQSTPGAGQKIGINLDTTDADDIGVNWKPGNKMRFANMQVYGAAYFEFSSVPSDLDAAVRWMSAEWKRGNRFLYPAPDWI